MACNDVIAMHEARVDLHGDHGAGGPSIGLTFPSTPTGRRRAHLVGPRQTGRSLAEVRRTAPSFRPV